MEQEHGDKDMWRRVRLFGIPMAVAFAAIVATRLSDWAQAAIAGVGCRMSAALPASLAIARWRSNASVHPNTPQTRYPPVVVISPPKQPQAVPGQPSLPRLLTGPTECHVTVVGGTYAGPRRPVTPDDW